MEYRLLIKELKALAVKNEGTLERHMTNIELWHLDRSIMKGEDHWVFSDNDDSFKLIKNRGTIYWKLEGDINKFMSYVKKHKLFVEEAVEEVDEDQLKLEVD